MNAARSALEPDDAPLQPDVIGDREVLPGDERVGRDRSLKVLVGLASLLVVMIAANQVSDLVAPVFMALNLMIVVWPIQRWLAKRTTKAIGSIGAGFVAVAALAALFWSIGWAASALIKELPHYKDKFTSLYDQGIELLGRFGITATEITDQFKTIDAGSVASTVGSVLSSVGGGLSLLVVVLSVMLFMAIDSMDFQARLDRVGQHHNPVLILALRTFAQGVRMYWVTSTVFGLIVAVLTYIGLWWIGVPLALVWAVLSFVTNFIPTVGFIIGLIPAALMGFLEKGVFGLVAVVVLYSVLNFVIQSVIQPKITGDAVGVTATVSFLSLLVWAFVLGPLGALLALPATLLAKALLIDADPSARWLNAFLAANPKTSREEPVIDTNRAALTPESPDEDDSLLLADPDQGDSEAGVRAATAGGVAGPDAAGSTTSPMKASSPATPVALPEVTPDEGVVPAGIEPGAEHRRPSAETQGPDAEVSTPVPDERPAATPRWESRR